MKHVRHAADECLRVVPVAGPNPRSWRSDASMADQFITPGELRDTAALPTVYCVPRDGSAVRETARSRTDLLRLRGELELLRRIARLATPGRFGRSSVLPGRYGEADRDELASILRDARHPVVTAMTRLVDEEFVSVRDEVLMSALYTQAEQICREATDAGVLEPAPEGEERFDWGEAAVEVADGPALVTPEPEAPPVAPREGAKDAVAPPALHESVERIQSSVERLRRINLGPSAGDVSDA
jgi:hypothetical protein